MNKYFKLAQIIKRAGREISDKDCYYKVYSINALLGITKEDGCIEVTDDSGYRSILIGDPYEHKGYALIYTENNSDGGYMYRCYPPAKLIAERLEKIAKGYPIYALEPAKDMAAYNDNGKISKSNYKRKLSKDTQAYVADVIERFADRAMSCDTQTA